MRINEALDILYPRDHWGECRKCYEWDFLNASGLCQACEQKLVDALMEKEDVLS